MMHTIGASVLVQVKWRMRRLNVFNRCPGEKWSASRNIEREDVAAAGWLIAQSPDRLAGQMAEQQRADAAVTAERDRPAAVRRVQCERRVDGLNNARLRINGTFPAAGRLMGPREELVSDNFEFIWWQIASGRPVILMHVVVDHDRAIGEVSKGPGRVDRLLLPTRPDRCQ